VRMHGEDAALDRESFGALLPISSPVVISPPDSVWSDAEWGQIRLGHRAFDMDDKWNAFVEGTRLFLHRSWTGTGMFEAAFEPSDTGWRIKDAVTESSAPFYRPGDEGLASDLLFLVVESVLLDRFHAVRWAESFVRLEPTATSTLELDMLLHGLLGNKRGRYYDADAPEGQRYW
jgi:hypothetical protein